MATERRHFKTRKRFVNEPLWYDKLENKRFVPKFRRVRDNKNAVVRRKNDFLAADTIVVLEPFTVLHDWSTACEDFFNQQCVLYLRFRFRFVHEPVDYVTFRSQSRTWAYILRDRCRALYTAVVFGNIPKPSRIRKNLPRKSPTLR